MEEKINSLLRHILTFGGGFLVTYGWIQESDLPGVVGAMLTIGGIVWAQFNKTKKSIVSQAANIDGTIVVTTPELAAAVPSADAVSSTDVKVVAR